jgi:hypothetical protein
MSDIHHSVILAKAGIQKSQEFSGFRLSAPLRPE